MLRRFDKKKNYKLKKKSYKNKQYGSGKWWDSFTKKKQQLPLKEHDEMGIYPNPAPPKPPLLKRARNTLSRTKNKITQGVVVAYHTARINLKERMRKSRDKINDFIEKLKEMIQNFKDKSHFNKEETELFAQEITEIKELPSILIRKKTNNSVSLKKTKTVTFFNNVNSNKMCENGNPIFPKNKLPYVHYLSNYDKQLCDNGKYIKFDDNKGKYCCSDTPATLDEMIEHCNYLLEIITNFIKDIPVNNSKIIEKNTNNNGYIRRGMFFPPGTKKRSIQSKKQSLLDSEKYIMAFKNYFENLKLSF